MRFRKKRSDYPAQEKSGNVTIEYIDPEWADQQSRKWVTEHTRRVPPPAEELSRWQAKHAGLKRAVQRDPRNQGMLTELGTVCLELDKPAEAVNVLRLALDIDPAFESLESLDSQVRTLAKLGEPFSLATATRRALCYLGFAYERLEKYKLAERCILDSLYDCHDPHLLVLGGKFYLESSSPEPDTGIAYFMKAAEITPAITEECDELLKRFAATRRILYPAISWAAIEKYLGIWESAKKKGR
jgi:tetratricopeptide (TPR) repeat protein